MNHGFLLSRSPWQHYDLASQGSARSPYPSIEAGNPHAQIHNGTIRPIDSFSFFRASGDGADTR
jgi:hypothetical protein